MFSQELLKLPKIAQFCLESISKTEPLATESHTCPENDLKITRIVREGTWNRLSRLVLSTMAYPSVPKCNLYRKVNKAFSNCDVLHRNVFCNWCSLRKIFFWKKWFIYYTQLFLQLSGMNHSLSPQNVDSSYCLWEFCSTEELWTTH